MSIVVALIAAAVSSAATFYAASRLAPQAPLRRSNYRGVLVPTAFGAVQLGGFAIGLAVVVVIGEVARSFAPGIEIVFPLAAAAGFGVLGLIDDVFSSLSHGPEHGFRLHTEALVHGRVTTGGFKLLAGAAVGFVLAAPAANGFAFKVIGGAVIALSANVLNCFDLRPGRAGKAFLAGAIPLAAAAGPLRAEVCAAIGAVLGLLPLDLRERVMAGDAGSNAFGAFLGACAVLLSTKTTLLVVLLVLVIIQIVAETTTLSRVIDALPPLHAADRWGRAPEPVVTTLPRD